MITSHGQFSSRSAPSLLKPYLVILSIWIILSLLNGVTLDISNHWPMMVTMVFGSFVAGSTSEGGGAVAFPVFTLLLGISPIVARDFSLLIQSIGMGMATFMILRQRSEVWYPAIFPITLGGIFGVQFGIFKLSPLLSPAHVKLFFVSMWLAFGAVLAYAHLRHKVDTWSPEKLNKGSSLFLMLIGFLGGTISGISGSGIDMLSFTVMTLLFGVPVRVATPTSVILMFVNALAGSIGLAATSNWSHAAIDMWWMCIPIVTLGAPLGARFIKGKSSHFLTAIITSICLFQFIAACLVLKPQGGLIWFVVATLFVSCLAFLSMRYCRLYYLRKQSLYHRYWS